MIYLSINILIIILIIIKRIMTQSLSLHNIGQVSMQLNKKFITVMSYLIWIIIDHF